MESLYEYILPNLKQSEILSAVVNSLNDPCCAFNFQALYFCKMYSEISFARSFENICVENSSVSIMFQFFHTTQLILLYHIAYFLSIDKKMQFNLYYENDPV